MGRDRLCQQPLGLHGSGRHAWQPVTPWLTARQAPRRFRHHQAGLVCRPAGFSTFSSSSTAKRQSRNFFSGRGPVFCTHWTGSAIQVSTAAVPALSAVTASEIRPLTSPHPGSGLHNCPVSDNPRKQHQKATVSICLDQHWNGIVYKSGYGRN